MERWLSRPRVLIALSAVLLAAALNRQDPTFYGMFLFLGMVTLLGFLLPWLSLRGTTVHLPEAQVRVLEEGEPCPLGLRLERAVPWPAFMVEIETEWEWAGRRTVRRHVVPLLRAGRPVDGLEAGFACRGHYRLTAVRLSSSFPLGLVRAGHRAAVGDVAVRVRPRAVPLRWPVPWIAVEDPLGERTTRAVGPSYELGSLRACQPGEAVARVSWPASARAGQLILQQFLHTGSVRLRLLVALSAGHGVGDPDSEAEQAVRMAVGLCDAALLQGVQVWLGSGPGRRVLQTPGEVRDVFSGAVDAEGGWIPAALALAAEVRAGEQVAVVLPAGTAPDVAVRALQSFAAVRCPLVVCIATAPRPEGASAPGGAASTRLGDAVLRAGFGVALAEVA
ncbi:DUF58 domain-containing protein [Paracidovorax konjaci]|uniref:Uncharacterized conserved protein, DUF58 family, contains vWF domain n=1 Tax=Paracidovorax konjaci TaxID=32040 RepID=A0A1I1TDQ9_9BURK|nr:DUF58 domain-containing protein [Paracidovorax konjaci]SFD56735.1 Uncharacterized conserved protein, DUF58 family, contains vWF domain [Paracidovorax konjaci]